MYLKDSTGRKIDYLRISITDRCNLRCRYCMPPGGVEFKPHNDILRYEEIIRIVQTGVGLGISKVRITGGEPLVRLGLLEFIKMLARIKGLDEISMTTNATLLNTRAPLLKEAGLQRINISLDTLKKEKYRQITSRDQLEMVLEGIDSSLQAGLTPVKVNVVVIKGFNDDEILDFVELVQDRPLHVRFIEFMPLGGNPGYQDERYISLEEIKNRITDAVKLVPVQLKGNGPASYYNFPGARGTVGFITPLSHNFCSGCNRLRLTSDGKLRPCLASEMELNLRDQEGRLKNPGEIKELFIKAVEIKPGSHNFDSLKNQHIQRNKRNHYFRNMSEIGG